MKTLAVLLALAASPVAAQSTSSSKQVPASGSPVIDGVRYLWKMDRDFLMAAAQEVPDSLYAVRPTPRVRSFGEVLAHVANAHHLFCGMALGDTITEGKWTTKADIIAALKSSNEYCARAYSMSDAEAMQPLPEDAQRVWRTIALGAPRSRLHSLTVNAWHDHEHYGNIATYMRLEGMVPPSSQPKK